MKITYEKFDEYYIFSNSPNKRVYLGPHSPDDYVEDELNQQKRTASAWYKEIHTGKDITWDDIMSYKHDGSKQGNGFVFYGPEDNWQKRENYTYEGGHTFDFERKVKGLASFGNGQRSATYVETYRSEAWAYVSGKTIEQQKQIEKDIEDRMEKFDREHPYLIGLHDRLGYLDGDRNPITVEEQQIMVKAKYGDDVFEIADAKVSPEIRKLVDQAYKGKE